MPGFVHIGDATAEILANIRFQRLVEHLHGLGPRAVGSIIAEVATEHGIGDEVMQRLERYRQVTPEMIERVNAENFPPAPLMEAPRLHGADAD